MALVNCKECGQEISTTAEACPKCGAKQPKRTSIGTWVAGAFLAIVMFSCINKLDSQRVLSAQEAARVEATKSPEQRAAEKRVDDERTAIYACVEGIKSRLKDPKSAEFPDWSSSWRQLQKVGTIKTQIEVRAKNSFGAFNLSVFECTATQVSPGSWASITSSIKEHK